MIAARRLCPIRKCVIATIAPVELDLELVPLDLTPREITHLDHIHRAFQPRIRPVTQQELADMDRVRGVKS